MRARTASTVTDSISARQRRAVADAARCRRRSRGSARPLRVAEQRAQPLEQPIVGRRQRDVAVGAADRLIRRAHPVRRSHRPAECRRRRNTAPTPTPTAPRPPRPATYRCTGRCPVRGAIVQRGENGREREQPGAEVGQRHADLHRRPARLAGHRHQARHALRDQIEAALARLGTGLAVAGDRRVDQRRMIRAPACRSRGRSARITPGPVVLDEDVGARGEPAERLAAPRGVFRSSTMPRLPRLTALKLGLSVPDAPAIRRVESPSGGSTLITSAPMSHSCIAQNGPAITCVTSSDPHAVERAFGPAVSVLSLISIRAGAMPASSEESVVSNLARHVHDRRRRSRS